jgi:hypothetical protein
MSKRKRAMNHSMYSADRMTHLKIVAVALLFASLVTVVGVFAQVSETDIGTAPLIQAGRSITLSGRFPAIR